MSKDEKKRLRKALTIPAVVICLASIALISMVFLPYATANEEHAEWIESIPNLIEYSNLDMTAGDVKNVSILTFTKIYCLHWEEIWNDVTYCYFYGAIFALLLGLPILLVLFALLRKPIAVLVLDGLTYGVFYVQGLDYAMRRVIPGAYYDFGIVYDIYPWIVSFISICGIWMQWKKSKTKRRIKADQVIEQ